MQSRELGDCGDCMAVYGEAGNVIETHEHKGELKEC